MTGDFRGDERWRRYGELTLADLERMRDHPGPEGGVDPRRLDELIENMRRGGAAKVDDLGREMAERWARTVGIIPKF